MRPRIILNCAASADGKIALPNRHNIKLSNQEDFKRVHNLRKECDAILVGIGTVIEDDPSLTVELGKQTKTNPIRIILDTDYRTPEDAKVLDNRAETIIAIGEKTKSEKKNDTEIIRCGINEIDIERLMDKLWKKGIESILVEGGETVMWSFLEKGLFDEFNVFVSSIIIGGESTPTIAGGKGISDNENSLKLKLVSSKALGNGVLLRYHKSND